MQKRNRSRGEKKLFSIRKFTSRIQPYFHLIRGQSGMMHLFFFVAKKQRLKIESENSLVVAQGLVIVLDLSHAYMGTR